VRLFVALFPPKDYQDYFRDVLREFPKVKRNLKLMNIEQVHLTLKFIGPFVEERSKNLIIDGLKSVEGDLKSPEITLEKVRFGFPKESYPTILMSKVKSSEGLVDLTDDVHNIIKDLRLIDTLRWKNKHDDDFHFTLARLKKSATKSDGKKVNEIASQINLELPKSYFPTEMFLVESVITAKGPSYKKLERISLN
jgi:2'-5' RNA ligase